MKLSIVTINFNDVKGLKKTLDSVTEQSFRDFQYVVIDGGSNDGSKELLESRTDEVDYWVSEPDKGIYNAMNKGLEQVLGEFVLFLNSGDRLYAKDVLEKVFESGLEADFNYGDLMMEEGDDSWMKKYPESLTTRFLVNAALPHQGLFIRKTVFDQYGGYNEDYRIVSDWLHYAELYVESKATFNRIPFPVSIFDRSGISSSSAHQELHDKERKEVLEKLFPIDILDLVRNYNELERENRKMKSLLKSRLVKLALKITRIKQGKSNSK